MAETKIAQSKPRTKRSAPKADQAEKGSFVISKEKIEHLDGLLARAQREAIEAAPREVPTRGGGEQAAIRAYDTIRWVRVELSRLVERTAGGAA